MLTENDVLQFERDGFVTFDTPLTQEQIDKAIKAFDELVPLGDKTDRFQATRRGGGNVDHPDLLPIIMDPFFEDAAKKLLRADAVEFFQSTILATYPDPDIEKSELDHPHTDTLMSLDDLEAIPRRMSVGYFLWLNDVTEETAPLYARPGSHRQIAEYRQNDPALRAEQPRIEGAHGDKLPKLDYQPLKCITAKAGQVTAITTATIHAASTNAGDWPRRTLVFSFTPKGVDFGLPPNQHQKRVDFNPRLRELAPADRKYLVPIFES